MQLWLSVTLGFNLHFCHLRHLLFLSAFCKTGKVEAACSPSHYGHSPCGRMCAQTWACLQPGSACEATAACRPSPHSLGRGGMCSSSSSAENKAFWTRQTGAGLSPCILLCPSLQPQPSPPLPLQKQILSKHLLPLWEKDTSLKTK